MCTDVDEMAKSYLESQLAFPNSNGSNLMQNSASVSSFQGVNKAENNRQQPINGIYNAVDTNEENLAFASLTGSLPQSALFQNFPESVNSQMLSFLTSSVDDKKYSAVNQNEPVNTSDSELTLSQPFMSQITSSSPINIPQASIAMIRPGTNGMLKVPTRQTVINKPGMQVANVTPGTTGFVQISQKQLAPRFLLAPEQAITSEARPRMPGIYISAHQGELAGQEQHLLLETENSKHQLPCVNHAPKQGQILQTPLQVSAQNMVKQSQLGQNVVQQKAAVTAQHNQAGASAASGPLMTLEKANFKLKNILVTLLKLSNNRAEGASKNVSTLVQALIDQKIQPEEFTQRIQKELNLSENQSLSPFLQKTLPYLRYSLATGDMKIDGLVPPSLDSAPAPPPVVPASPMSRLGSKTVANAPIIRAIQPYQFQRPQTQITVQAPIATQHTIGASPGPPRTPNIQNRKVIPKGKVPYRNLEPRNQLKTVNKGIESPVSMCSFVQKSIISKENKFSSSLNSSAVLSGDDDINDVATMGGVNLAEESQRLLGPTKLVGTQIRSVEDEVFFPPTSLQGKVRKVLSRYPGIEEISSDFITLLSHAAQERLKNILERLLVVTEHKMEFIKNKGDYYVGQDVRAQIRFLEDLEKAKRKKHEENERETLLKAAKSRSRTEDPEQQAKLRAKVKEMQRVEMEEMHQAEANRTALQAIGSRKKPKLETVATRVAQMPYSQRLKRPTVREMLFILEEDKETCRSSLLYKAFVK